MRGNSQLRVLLMAKTSATLRLVIPALEGMRLEEIDVSGCSMEPETAAVLTQQIANSDTLRALNLSGCGLSAEAVGYLLARLTSNTRLRQTQLQAGGNLITTLSPEVLSNALMSNCNLHTLDLSTTYLNEESILEFFGCLTRNSNTLDTLVLDDDFTYYISSHVSGVRTAHALADMLQQTGLKKLSLKGTSSVMPVGIKSFSADPKRVLVPLLDRLKRNDTLLELDISNNQLGNAIAVSIADVLRYNTTLVALNCDNNRITLNGWAAIAVAFRHNRTLQHFAFPVLDSQKCAAALGSEKKQQKLYALLTSIQLATNANQAAGLHPRLLAKRQQDPLSAPPAVPQPPGTAPRTVPANLAPSTGTAAAPAENSWATSWDATVPITGMAAPAAAEQAAIVHHLPPAEEPAPLQQAFAPAFTTQAPINPVYAAQEQAASFAPNFPPQPITYATQGQPDAGAGGSNSRPYDVFRQPEVWQQSVAPDPAPVASDGWGSSQTNTTSTGWNTGGGGGAYDQSAHYSSDYNSAPAYQQQHYSYDSSSAVPNYPPPVPTPTPPLTHSASGSNIYNQYQESEDVFAWPSK